MRTKARVALLAGVALAVGSAAAFGPLVRAAVARRAEALRLVVDVGSVSPGWGGLSLGDVRVRVPDVPAVTVRLERIDVGLGMTLSPTEVVVSGGTVQITGDSKAVAQQVDAWRARRPAGGGGGTGPRIVARGVHAEWSRDGVTSPAVAWGVRFERDGDRETLAADLARGTRGPVTVEIGGLTVELRRGAAGRRVAAVRGASARVDVLLDGAPVELVRVTGHADAPSPAPSSRRHRLGQALGRAGAALDEAVPDGATLELDGLHLALHHGGQTLNFGPGTLRVSREAGEIGVELLPGGAGQRSPLTLRLEAPVAAGPVKLHLDGGPVTLAALGIRPGDAGLADVERATVEARVDAELSAGGDVVSVDARGRLEDVTVSQPWLAPQPITGLSLGWRVKGVTDPDLSIVTISEGALELGPSRFELRGEVRRDGEHFAANLTGGVPLASCQSILDSLPRGLAPLVEGVRVGGTFSLAGSVVLDTRAIGKTRIDATAANECRVTAVPPNIHPSRFRAPFERTVVGADGRPTSITSGPGAPGWVPLAAISPHVETAVLVCEDGRFYRHRGFDEEAVHGSLKENLRQRRFARGASTISMQLAKNLYLAREKTVSRKLQEVLLTMVLEQHLGKREILELYLNVIEFGPGLYGIGPAAFHYFGTGAGDLSLGQSLYLASILPRPTTQHFGAGGVVSDGWSAYLRRLMHVARKIGRVTDAELADGLAEVVTYGVPRPPRRELLPEEDPRTGAEPSDESLLPGPREAFPGDE